MAELFQAIAGLMFLIIFFDQREIAKLKRTGQFDPETHRSLLYLLTIGLLKFVISKTFRKTATENVLPTGDLSMLQSDTTVCMSKLGRKTRLSYFFDDNQHAWYKIEKINHRGVPTDSPKFEPATVPFDVKKLQYV
ncbi:MAG: hypothetical protein R3271_11230 [Methylophaga sp.]|jgi:hypothetical protein|uniref:hypothetical protein n=1 Tax=Methylophaga sp. TaxID=2024840 RepID=UPI00299EEE70|nr:hypothetical protein [Methylophaga sp.]MDX1750881.1 hypothetical protein [Methylophaga sp.]